MSLSATCTVAPHEPAETRKLLLVVWAVTVAAYLIGGQSSGLSADDAMRLVQVRDLLAGQGWFDLTQYRLNPPGGVEMHWSRLVDVPIAALIRAGEWLLPAAQAERLATTVWPAVLLLAFLAGLVRFARALGGDTAARLALIFAALMAPVLQHFRPGAIDHHNVQLVLMMWMLALVVSDRQRDVAIAGLLGGLSLAVGQELAPVVAVCAAAVALRWIVRGETSESAAAAFGLSFAMSTLFLFAATVPPSRYGTVTCDALSIAQTLVALLGGGGLALLSIQRALSTVGQRAVAAFALCGVIATTVGIGFPQCLGDPYRHLDTRLVTLWLSNVSEARSIGSLARDLPHELLLYYGLPSAGLAAGLFISLRERRVSRWAWIAGTAALTAGTLLALWQVRGCAAANAIALAMVPAALVRAFPAPDGRGIFFGLSRPALVAALVLNPLTLLGIGNGVAWTAERFGELRRPVVITDGPGTCSTPADYAPLAKLPPGLVLGFIDAGPFILMQTAHAVLAAPYHRNAAGNRAMLDAFLGRREDAGTRLAQLGVDYVVLCPGAPERHNYAAAAPDGLATVLTRGETQPGLERIKLDGTELVVYRRLR
jgi:hypothetical protein